MKAIYKIIQGVAAPGLLRVNAPEREIEKLIRALELTGAEVVLIDEKEARRIRARQAKEEQ